jgi:hypothetical protein
MDFQSRVAWCEGTDCKQDSSEHEEDGYEPVPAGVGIYFTIERLKSLSIILQSLLNTCGARRYEEEEHSKANPH